MPIDTTSTPQVITVSALNLSVARLLEKHIPLCWIAGEVSNFTRAASGHWYFTLKDAQAQVRAVMFKSRAIGVDFIPREGEKIEVRATVTLYAPRGDYQLSVEGIRRAGVGNLYEAFLQLKQKLSLAGLFANERKQAIPTFPHCIGIITSPQAAALRDILITLQRRAPHVRIILYPTPVQGNGAAEKIVLAIQTASRRQECDVLIVARGGGSIEDLWSFNDEQVAYAIADCPLPVITGIGHETDFTIADFVADLRAPTPTAAAEMAVSARAELHHRLENWAFKLQRSVQRAIEQENQRLDNFTRRLISPMARIHHERIHLFSLQKQVKHAFQSSRKQAFFQFAQLKQRMEQGRPEVYRYSQQLVQLSQQFRQVSQRFRQTKLDQVTHLSTQLELLNPQRTLERGYAILADHDGKILHHPDEFRTHQAISVRLALGTVELDVRPAQQTTN